MEKLAMLLLLPFAIATRIEDPCQRMTVADCVVGEDNIVDRSHFPAEVCEQLCKLSDNCHFWRFHQSDSMDSPECLHLHTDYHKDCASFAGPIDGDIESCLNTDLSTCSAYIGEECQYDGRREDLEPLPEEVSSIEECQAWGKIVHSSGANYFFYDGITEECQMFDTMQSSCSAIGGPETAPPLEQCTCDQGWDTFGDHCYFYGTDTKSWFDAEDYCKEEGGHLASVNTPAIQDYVLNELTRRGLDYAWFGGNDIEEEGVWKWTDLTPWEFTSWGPGEPDNHNGNQDCLVYDDNKYKWDDIGCSTKETFVCSKNIWG